MKVLHKILVGSTLMMTSGVTMAHSGHHDTGLLTAFLHSLSNINNLPGILLLAAGLILTHQIYRSRK